MYIGSRDGNIILWDTRTQQHSSLGKPDSTIRNSHGDTPFKIKKKHGGIPNLSKFPCKQQSFSFAIGASGFRRKERHKPGVPKLKHFDFLRVLRRRD